MCFIIINLTSKYFKIIFAVDFGQIMDKNENNEDGIARFIAYQCNKII